MSGACVQAAEFWGLGLQPLPVSAISGTGTGDLMDALMAMLPPPRQPERAQQPSSDEPIAVAILGRPNVGKSSLLNSLVRAPQACTRLMQVPAVEDVQIDMSCKAVKLTQAQRMQTGIGRGKSCCTGLLHSLSVAVAFPDP